MTVRYLKSVFEMIEELSNEGGEPVAYVYQRTTGEIRFAVFRCQADCDLHKSPEVEMYAAIDLQ